MHRFMFPILTKFENKEIRNYIHMLIYQEKRELIFIVWDEVSLNCFAIW